MYDYNEEKKYVFTEQGLIKVLEILDKLKNNQTKNRISLLGMGDSFKSMACIDWLVKNNYIIEKRKKTGFSNYWTYKLNKKKG